LGETGIKQGRVKETYEKGKGPQRAVGPVMVMIMMTTMIMIVIMIMTIMVVMISLHSAIIRA
jgi:hypothetical protein